MKKYTVHYFYKSLFKKGKNHIIKNITNNSKEAKVGSVFYLENDNCTYLKEAIKNGCFSFVLGNTFKLDSTILSKSYNIMICDNVKIRYADDLSKLYSSILKKTKIITITGTNGKTTVSTLLYRFLLKHGYNVSLIGSNGNYLNDSYFKTLNTTSDISIIYQFLINLNKKKGRKYIIIEASSHGIKNLRLRGIKPNLSLFTNLTLDHLDFHKTMEDYRYTKLMHLVTSKVAIINYDDLSYDLYSKYLKGFLSYSMNKSKHVEYYIDSYKINDSYNFFKIVKTKPHQEIYDIKTNLHGKFNALNLLGVFIILDKLGFKKNKIIEFLNESHTIDGRMNQIDVNNRHVIVDFSHTPDGVKNVLEYFNQKKKNKIITVIGCGGSKDRIKRAIIGEIASDLSDYVIFTSDNPRSENPMDILNEITKTITKVNYTIIENRAKAIDKAIEISSVEDYILVLGKGNEEEVIYSDKRIKHNDIKYIKEKYGI